MLIIFIRHKTYHIDFIEILGAINQVIIIDVPCMM